MHLIASHETNDIILIKLLLNGADLETLAITKIKIKIIIIKWCIRFFRFLLHGKKIPPCKYEKHRYHKMGDFAEINKMMFFLMLFSYNCLDFCPMLIQIHLTKNQSDFKR